MKIKVTVPNKSYSRKQWIIDKSIQFNDGVAEFEGEEKHVNVLRGMKGYVVEVEKPKPKARPKKEKDGE